MSTNNFETFARHARLWINKLGLSDWLIEVRDDKDVSASAQAEVTYNAATRRALISSHFGHMKPSTRPAVEVTPERAALHEALHIAVADLIIVAAKRGNDAHEDVVLEEHRLIERLMKVM